MSRNITHLLPGQIICGTTTITISTPMKVAIAASTLYVLLISLRRLPKYVETTGTPITNA